MAMTIETLTQRVEVLEKRVEVLDKQLALLLAEKNKQPVSEKNPKKSKKEKDESSYDEKPKKKRTSGYILFSIATRDEVRDALTKDEEKPKNTDIVKELARLWKELSDEDKEPWNAKAKKLRKPIRLINKI